MNIIYNGVTEIDAFHKKIWRNKVFFGNNNEIQLRKKFVQFQGRGQYAYCTENINF